MGVMGIIGSQGVMASMDMFDRILGAGFRKCEVPSRASARSERALYAGRHACTSPPLRRTTRYVRLTVAFMPTPLTRELVRELHCIQAIENISSIMKRGILSHDRAASIPHRSVAMQEIQDRRAQVTVRGTARKLHSYANLYINGRNKMMYKLARYTEGVSASDLCLLRVSDDVLDLPGVVIADRNASADLVRFAPSPAGLANVTKDSVYARYWNHDDPIQTQLHGSLVCAEVLVPDLLPPEYIVGAYASCDGSVDEILDAIDSEDFTVTIKPSMFFA
jgi:hypothetical protein